MQKVKAIKAKLGTLKSKIEGNEETLKGVLFPRDRVWILNEIENMRVQERLLEWVLSNEE